MGNKFVYTSADYAAADLLQAGLDHFDAAATLMTVNYRHLDSAGYLCHMAIELMLKAWAIHSTGSFEPTHHLQKLITILAAAGANLDLSERQNQILKYISGFNELRYPSLKNPVGIGTEDIELVTELVEAIWQQIPDDLVIAYESIPVHKKGRRAIMKRRKEIPRDLQFETGITAK